MGARGGRRGRIHGEWIQRTEHVEVVGQVGLDPEKSTGLNLAFVPMRQASVRMALLPALTSWRKRTFARSGSPFSRGRIKFLQIGVRRKRRPPPRPNVPPVCPPRPPNEASLRPDSIWRPPVNLLAFPHIYGRLAPLAGDPSEGALSRNHVPRPTLGPSGEMKGWPQTPNLRGPPAT